MLKRGTVIGLVASVLAVVGVALASSSEFDSAGTETPSVRMFANGSLAQHNSKDGAAILTAAEMKPGDSVTGTVTISNTGDIPGWFTLSESQLVDTAGRNGGALSGVLDVVVQDVTATSAPVTVYSGGLGAMPTRALGKFAPGEARTYRFQVEFPDGGMPLSETTEDNAYMGSSMSVQFDWTASDGAEVVTSDGAEVMTSDGAEVVTSNEVPRPPPLPPVLLLTASTRVVVFGQAVTLTGTLTQSRSGISGRPVDLSARATGAAGFTPLAPATTDAAGTYTMRVAPAKHTTYKATYGSAPEQIVSIAVRHLVTLSVVRKGGKGFFRGRLGPSHPRRVVTIESKRGSRWVRIAKLKTSSRSTFRTVKGLKPRGKYRFRARAAADREHLSGSSPIVYVPKKKVTLAVAVRGRKATFTGRVSPANPAAIVALKRLVGTRWVRFAKVNLSRRSTFSLTRTLAPGSYQFRAERPPARDHWGGTSPVRRVVVS